jgi:hypothetical protein
MVFKKIFIVLFLGFLLLPNYKIFAQSANTGFVSANIWYSKDPFQEGDNVKIYTLVFNPDTRELDGTVFFFDNDVLLGQKDFTVSGSGTKAINVNWTVTAGDHSIFAKIENAKFLVSAGKYEEVYLTNNETQKSDRSVSKKIIPTSSNTNTDDTNTISNIAQNTVQTIEDKTPDFITKPVVSTTNSLETLRQNTNKDVTTQKEEIQNEIKALDNQKVSKKVSAQAEKPSPLLEPFKYVEVFFLSVLSAILNNKILFYGLLIVIVFFILRFIWRKIF